MSCIFQGSKEKALQLGMDAFHMAERMFRRKYEEGTRSHGMADRVLQLWQKLTSSSETAEQDPIENISLFNSIHELTHCALFLSTLPPGAPPTQSPFRMCS